MSANMNIVNIYTRVVPQFVGSITRSEGFFYFNQKDASVSKNLGDRLRKSFSDGWNPVRITGVRDTSGAMIDFASPLSEDSVEYWTNIVGKLRYDFPNYYFVLKKDAVDWKNIEKEMGEILQSGALEESEKKMVLQALSHAGEEEVILIHFLLSRIYKGFVSLLKGVNSKE